MNICMNDLLKRLQNGENAQDIANEFADMLNAANAEMESQKKAKERNERKINELQVVLNLFEEWIKEFYPKLHEKIITNQNSAESVVKLLDESENDIVELFSALDELTALFKNFNPNKIPKKKNAEEYDIDNIINNFLKNNYLL